MDKQQAVDQFVSNVRHITDNDYGDYMRKSNTYFNRLLENFSQPSNEVKDILLQLKTHIQYCPDRNIDQTTLNVMDLAKKLKSKF